MTFWVTFSIALLLAWPAGANADGPHARPAVTPPTAAPLDLAAVVPAPADLGPAFVNSGAQLFLSSYYLATGAVTAKEIAADGFEGTYGADLSVLDPNHPLSELQHLRVFFARFGSDAGAHAYLASLPAGAGLHIVTSAFDIGADITVTAGSGTKSGRAFTSRVAHYRLGSLVVALTITNYGAASPDGLPLSDAGLTTLATTINDRLAKVNAGALGGLEPMILRLGDETHLYTSAYEAYIVLDGVYTPRYGVSTAETNQLKTMTNGLTDEYEATQAVGKADAPHALFTNIYRFDGASSAHALMAAMPAVMVSDPEFSSVTALSSAAAFGEESLAFSYERPAQSGAPAVSGQRLLARTGAMVVSIGLEDVTAPAVRTAEQLMTAQLNCVAAGSCPNPIPLPS